MKRKRKMSILIIIIDKYILSLIYTCQINSTEEPCNVTSIITSNEEPCYDFVRDDGEAGKGNGPY